MENFSTWIGEIPSRRYNDAREGIMKATGVSRQTFSNWQKGLQQPCDINNIRIAHFAQTHGLPSYMSATITACEMKKDEGGNKWIYAQVAVNEHIKEERYVVYLE